MSSFTERLSEAFAYATQLNPRITKKGLANACGISSPAVSAWFSGATKKISVPNLVAASKYLGVSERWLANGVGEMIESNVKVVDDSSEIDESEYVRIPEYSISFEGGDGTEGESITYDEIKDASDSYYSRDFFISRHINPEKCKVFRVRGDSMEPLICDGDRILVDCSPQEIISGKIYAFAMNGKLRVKYLSPLLKGGYLVRSHNTAFEDEVLQDDELNSFVLIGRVRDRSGGSFL